VGIWARPTQRVSEIGGARAPTAGILCSAVPMTADLLALRRVPARFFGVFMSINPVFAALAGLLVLGQSLELADWLAIAAIVTANAVSVCTRGHAAPAQLARRSRTTPASGAELRRAAEPSRAPERPGARCRQQRGQQPPGRA
jgi:inner membrane transporter RhtA